MEVNLECQASIEFGQERNLEQSDERNWKRDTMHMCSKYKEKTHLHYVDIHMKCVFMCVWERQRERENSIGECGQTQETRGCLHGVERLVDRFSRLRTPLGLVVRRLSADRDRETGCIPNATLYSAAMSERTGMCSPLTTDGFPFSPSVSPPSPSPDTPLLLSIFHFARCFASHSPSI